MTSSTPEGRNRRPGRTAGLTNLGIAVGVLALLLPLLLKAASGAPPTAAEFAPNAKQVIKEPPPGAAVAAAAGGSSPGASASPSASASAGPSPSASPSAQSLAVPQNALRACVGPAPLRQTEDPQSPPCVQYWLGKDNGGATAPGVTRDAIHIAVPTHEGRQKEYTALANHFNKRFEFYGRKLVFEFCNPAGGSTLGSPSEANQNADAAQAAAGCGGSGHRPFASTFYRNSNGRHYMQEMGCRHKIIAVGSYTPYDSVYMKQCAPYLYQYLMETDREFAYLGDWACKRLVGRNAVHADGNDGSTPGRALNGLKRNFGVFLAPYYADDPVARESALRPLLDRLRQCGFPVPADQVIINPVANSGGVTVDPTSANNAILQMKSKNVTSIFCLCNLFGFGALQKAATSQSYRPEWLASSYGPLDIDVSYTLGASPKDQLANTFGLTFAPRQVNPALEPYNAAVNEGDPSVAPSTTTNDVQNRAEIYRPLLLLASGIQMAGPNLTVQTFRDGLRKAAFPNPATESVAGAVDMPADGWSLTSDAAEWWYSTTAVGPHSDSSSNRGTICYVAGGERRRIGGWPSGPDPFFGPRCNE